jgi:hypothetical protein
MKNKQNDAKTKAAEKSSGRQSADNGKKMIQTEKIAQGKKNDKNEKEKEASDAAQWRNEG